MTDIIKASMRCLSGAEIWMETENSSDALSGRIEIPRPPRQAGTVKSLRSVQLKAAVPVQAGMSLD